MSKYNGIGIKVRPGEPIDSALKRFKSQVEKADLLNILYRKSYYLKPSAAKKEKRNTFKKTSEQPIEEFSNE